MEMSDFLTILGLALAVWAVIPNKERKFIELFFSNFEILGFIIFLFIIHYLMAFEWIMENWCPSLLNITVDKGIPSKTWSYIISLAVIAYPIVKVSFGYFSKNKLTNLIELYKSLLRDNEIDLLVIYIQKYHIDDIENYLKQLSKRPVQNSIDFILRKKENSDEEYNEGYDEEYDEGYKEIIESKRILFASWVYGHILQNDTFVRSASNTYPELFATAFRGMEAKKATNPNLVKIYIECLFEAKNQKLIEELKILNDSEASILERSKDYEIPILFSLLANTKVAVENSVWYPVGESAIKSLKIDLDQQSFLIREYDSNLEDELWSKKIYIATIYFKYMVRETIYRNSENHMWLFYFQSFTEHLIEIIPNSDRESNNYLLFAHYMIKLQFSTMFEWLDLAKNKKTDNRVIDTIRCLGWCFHSICETGKSKISDDFKKELLNSILIKYFTFSRYPSNLSATTTREWLEKLFLNPKGVDFGIPIITNEYKILMREVWDKFNKVPYQYNEENGSIERFMDNVLIPLGIDLNKTL